MFILLTISARKEIKKNYYFIKSRTFFNYVMMVVYSFCPFVNIVIGVSFTYSLFNFDKLMDKMISNSLDAGEIYPKED
jgi:hypothetical protein